MLRLKALIKNIDFDSIISFCLPILKANPPEIDGNFIIKGAVNKLLNADSSTIKGIAKIIPDGIKISIILNSVTKNHTKIETAIMNMAKSQNLSLYVKNFEISQFEDAISVNCSFDNIDYGSFIRKFLPMIKVDSMQSEMNKYLDAILPVVFSKFDDIDCIVNAIDNYEKESFLASMVCKNSIKIIDLLSKFVSEKGISLTIDSMAMEVL
ncbi:MAG: hypothetical protein K5751_00885 [Treponemataceae bacterium]|nr:hypothetical protein [Treponemataceae bacterium]